jgi:hypothetical protein
MNRTGESGYAAAVRFAAHNADGRRLSAVRLAHGSDLAELGPGSLFTSSPLRSTALSSFAPRSMRWLVTLLFLAAQISQRVREQT